MNRRIRELLSGLHRDEDGAQLLEYILVTVLIGIAGFSGMAFLGHAAQSRTDTVAVTVQNLGG